MNDDSSFSIFGREEAPEGDWSLQPRDFDQLESFGKGSFDFGYVPSRPTVGPPMDFEHAIPPAPHSPFFDLVPPPVSAPAPARCKLTPAHKKVPSSAVPADRFWPVSAAHHLRQRSLPDSSSLRLDSDAEFEQVSADSAVSLNPQRLGFIPSQFWSESSITFGQLVRDFFQKKNHANSRFAHKLYNALKITTDDPFYIEFIGIEWITDNVLRIDKRKFARLLAIKTIDGSLFHQQGNFPSHGFVELAETTALDFVTKDMLFGVDFDNIRLLVHQDGVFKKGCTEEDIGRCKWISARRRNLAAMEGAD
jgi:hypothetical protein